MDEKKSLKIPEFLRRLAWLSGLVLAGNVVLCRITSGQWSLAVGGYTLICLAVLFVLLYRTSHYIKIVHNALNSLENDDFDPGAYATNMDRDPIMTSIRHLHQRNEQAVHAMQTIFDEDGENISSDLKEHDIFRKAIAAIRAELQHRNKQEALKNWIVQGLANFGELIRNEEHDFANLAGILVSELVKYTNCNQGAIFIANTGENGTTHLEKISSYAYDRHRFGKKIVEAGDGLLGQCLQEKATIYLKDVPEDYIEITSGLGFATPTNVVIVPMVANENIYGVIELASFAILEEHQISFLEKLAENLALSVASYQNKKHTNKLLEESQNLSAELQEKELEMQDNLEKLISTQEEMRHHQMELDGLFRAINNYLITAEVDLKGNIMGTNSNMLRLFGYKYEEIIDLSISRLLNNNKILSEQFWNDLNHGSIFSTDILCHNKSAQPFWLRATFAPVEDVSGDIYKVLMLAEDVTGKKLQEVELQSHLQAIDQTIAAVEFTMDGKIVRVNPIYSGITGYKPEELTGSPYSILLPEEDKNTPQSLLLWESLQNGQFFSGIFKHIDKQGKEQWLSGTFNPIFDINGKPKQVVMFADFITEGKEKQNELQGMVKAMKASFPYLELNAKAVFKTGNKSFFAALGYKRLDLQRQDLRRVMTTDSFEKLGKVLEAITENGFADESFDWVNSTGHTLHSRVTLSAINNLENKVDKIILIPTFEEPATKAARSGHA